MDEIDAKLQTGDVNVTQEMLNAAEQGHLDVVKYLVEHNANVNLKDADSRTSLHKAIRYESLSVVKYLVEQNADVAARDLWGKTPLHGAAGDGGHLEVVKYLVEHGHADMNARDEFGNTPLHRVLAHARYQYCAELQDIVQYLVAKGADLNVKNESGMTMLHFCYGYLDNIRSILAGNYNIDINTVDMHGETAVTYAIRNSNLDGLKYLVEQAHADIHIKDEHGRNSVHQAAILYYRPDHIEYLVKHGADPHAKDKFDWTPLHVAAFYCEPTRYDPNCTPDPVKIKNEHHDIGIEDDDQNGHVFLDTKHGNLDACRYLVEKCGVNIHAKNMDGKTALDLAKDEGRDKIVHYLTKMMEDAEGGVTMTKCAGKFGGTKRPTDIVDQALFQCNWLHIYI